MVCLVEFGVIQECYGNHRLDRRGLSKHVCFTEGKMAQSCTERIYLLSLWPYGPYVR